MRSTLVDIGVNLTHAAFHDDLPQVLERAAARGVARMVVTGTSVAGSRAALTLAQAHPGVLSCTAGVHPHDARHCDAQTIPALRELAAHPEVVALGECGLDFNRDYSPHREQEKWFIAQLELACETGKPVFVHARDAHPRVAQILQEFRARLARVVVHCYTGEAEELRAYLELDCHIGITGWICDERRGRHLHALLREIPADRLLLETDAPYLTPRDLRPQPHARRNEPAFLPHIAATVARALGKPVQQLARETSANARAFFNLTQAGRIA